MSAVRPATGDEATARLLADLEALGVTLWEESGQLHFRAPKGILNDERKAALRQSKQAILDHLQAESLRELTPEPEARFEPFPLTEVQAAYVLGRSDAFAYGGTGCHAYGEIRMRDVDPAALERAWQATVRRHDMLRAVIDMDGSQRVLPDVPPYRIRVADLRGRNAAAVQAQVEATRRELDHRVYAPNETPLFDLRLTLADGYAVLHLSLDFLIADYVSIHRLLDEWNQLYLAPDCQLPPLSITFRDYQIAERRLRAGRRYERDRAYWWNRIDSLPPAPKLPTLESNDAGPPRFRRLAALLDADVWDALKKLAAAHGITPSGALLSAYAETIGRWSRSPRFTLDITVLQRLPVHPEVGRLVGDFTSVSLLAVDLAAPRFDLRAKAVQAQLWEDLDHRLFSGIEVIREIGRRRGAGAALMPVIFTSAIGLNAERPAAGSELGEFVYGISQTPQAWIDCQAMEQSGGLNLSWDVREGVIPGSVIDDMFGAFQGLVRELASGEDAWQQGSPIHLPKEQELRRRAANDTAEPTPLVRLYDGFLEHAAQRGGGTAVITPQGRLSYAELQAKASAIAQALDERVCGQGDVVAIVMEPGPAQIASVLGVLFTGAAYLPIEPRHPSQRRNGMLQDAGVRLLLTEAASRTNGDLPDTIERIDVDLLSDATRPIDRGVASGLAYVVYTSGSTGVPKGVMIRHDAAANTIADINRRFGVTGNDRVLGISSLSFDLSVYDVFGPLSAGGCLVLPDPARRRDPSHWVELIRDHSATIWDSVPAQMQMLEDYLQSEGGIAPPLRLILLSGDWIPVPLARRLRERYSSAKLMSLGGATEASIWSIRYPITDLPPGLRRIPYGKPLANQTFHVLDTELRSCPDWVTGELYIGGRGLAEGYFGDQKKTEEAFLHHPENGTRLYRTGDLGRYLPDGNIEFLGREDSQVKIRGHRIELAEIAAALESHPALAAATVVVYGEGASEKRLAAFAEGKRGINAAKDSVALLSGRIQAAAAPLRESVDCERVVRFARQLDETALLEMVHALRQQGLFQRPEDRHTRDEIFARTRVAPRHHRLLRRWLQSLQVNGMLRYDPAANCYHGAPPVTAEDVSNAWLRADQLRPESDRRTELMDYFRLAGEHLPELLRSELDPVQLLFPEGRVEIHEVAYNDGFLSRYLNRIATEALREIASRHDGRGKLRILEPGAGVGGTSIEVIPALAGFDADYLFTDVSNFFLNNAKERFCDFPWVHYALFDINQDYRAQGLTANSFDVVLCANVLHYAHDAGVVLQRFRELLRPGGWLVFIEMVRDNYQVLTSMEFLFDEKAGDFEDVRRGRDATFIGLEQWHELLRGAGAGPALCLPGPGDNLADIGFHVFAAQFKTDYEFVDSAELMEHLKLRLPDYMLPAHIEVVDRMPLNENGKVDRAKVRTWLPARKDSLGPARDHEPGTDLEQRVAAVWKTVLNLPDVGLDQNFFEVGGDSLLAAQLAGRMREQLPEAKTLFFDSLLRLLLDGPTVRKISATLEESRSQHKRTARPAQASPLIRVLGPCGQPALFLVHDSSGTLASYASLLRELAGGESIAGLVANDPDVYRKLPPEVLFERIAADYARALSDHTAAIHLVGYEMGGVLATEVARCLAESGVSPELTLISSVPPWFVIEDDLAAEYLFARNAGIDPMRLGYASESAMARALDAVLAATPDRIGDGSLSRLDGDPDLAGAAWCMRRLGGRSREERLAAIAERLTPAGSAPFGTEQVSDLLDMFLHTITGAALLSVRPYAGNIHLLRPSGPTVLWPSLQERATAFWQDRCLGQLETIDVPGDHFTCLNSSHAIRVAHILKSRRRTRASCG